MLGHIPGVKAGPLRSNARHDLKLGASVEVGVYSEVGGHSLKLGMVFQLRMRSYHKHDPFEGLDEEGI